MNLTLKPTFKFHKHFNIPWKKWHFWFKLSLGLFILGVLFSGYFFDLFQLAVLHKNVNLWLKSLEQDISFEVFWKKFNQNFGSLKGYEWINFLKTQAVINEAGNVLSPPVFASRVGYGAFTIHHFSYFTVLSNLAIGFWMLGAAFQSQKEGTTGYFGYRFTVILTTYITITMLIWNGLLLPTSLLMGDIMNAQDWFFGLTQHALFPLLFIGYVLCFFQVENQVLTKKQYAKQEWKRLILFLLIYGAYCLIRGEFRYRANELVKTQYPYFFFRIHASKVNGLHGAIWFLIAFCLIAMIAIGFSSFYNFILERRHRQKSQPPQSLNSSPVELDV